MPGPYPDQQRSARTRLASLFAGAEHARVVHYSCESLDDRESGLSPRVTSIAVRRMDSSDTTSFSIHQAAERRGVGIEGIEEDYNDFERAMLAEFYAYVAAAGEGTKYLHWNMRDANYGFAALEHRFRVLGGDPIHVPENRRIDLSPLLLEIYGTQYIEHPRLLRLAARNGITAMDMLTGAEEAEAFGNRKYVALHKSTLRKVDVIQSLAERAYRGTLRTNSTWWQLHGGSVRGVTLWLADNKVLALIIALVGIAVGLGLIRIPVFH